MKKYLLCFCLWFPSLLCGECYTVEARAGYFFSSNHLVRKIYHHGGAEFEIQGSVQLYDQFSLWSNFNYFTRSGHSIGLYDKTTIQIYPLSAGISYSYAFHECMEFYFGVGGSYSWLRTHDHSSFVQRHTHKQAWGGVAKSGIHYFFSECYFLDLFADYYYTKIRKSSYKGVENRAVNIGGVRVGLGLGMMF